MSLHSSRTALLSLCVFWAVGTGYCQTRDGFNAQETPGIALIKPQTWSKESSATVLEFEAFTDRRARGAAASGYIEFRTPSGQSRQVDASRIFQVVVYPDVEQLPDVVEQADRDRIEATLREIDAVVQRFPMTRSYLAPRVGPVVKMLKRFDEGEVKIEGKWVTRRVYQEQQAVQIAEILKVDIEQAQPASAFNLEVDPKYQVLVSLGSTSPKARRLASELNALYSSRVNAERIAEISSQLVSPGLPLERARKLVEELDKLSPATGSPSKALLERWEVSDLEASALAKIADPLSAKLEALLRGKSDPGSPPDLDPETRDAVDSLARRMVAFKKLPPPDQITEIAARADAIVAVVTALDESRTLFPEKKYLDAKTALDAAASRAPVVGSESSRVIRELQNFAAARIAVFTAAREEATSHAEAGRTAEALEKFKEAYEVIPNAAVEESIRKLESESATQ